MLTVIDVYTWWTFYAFFYSSWPQYGSKEVKISLENNATLPEGSLAAFILVLLNGKFMTVANKST